MNMLTVPWQGTVSIFIDYNPWKHESVINTPGWCVLSTITY